MNQEERERRRAQQIRESQIRSRDPGPSKIPHYDWSKHKKPPRKQEPLLTELFNLLPSRGRGAVFGGLIGVLVAILIRLLLPVELSVLGLLAIIMCGVVGWVLGKTAE